MCMCRKLRHGEGGRGEGGCSNYTMRVGGRGEGGCSNYTNYTMRVGGRGEGGCMFQ